MQWNTVSSIAVRDTPNRAELFPFWLSSQPKLFYHFACGVPQAVKLFVELGHVTS